MIAVYPGPLAALTIKSPLWAQPRRFLRGVPGWIPRRVFDSLPPGELVDATEYDGDTVAGPPVLLSVARRKSAREIATAMHLAGVLQTHYPTCPIHVYGHEPYAAMFPGCEYITGYAGGRPDYYREIDGSWRDKGQMTALHMISKEGYAALPAPYLAEVAAGMLDAADWIAGTGKDAMYDPSGWEAARTSRAAVRRRIVVAVVDPDFADLADKVTAELDGFGEIVRITNPADPATWATLASHHVFLSFGDTPWLWPWGMLAEAKGAVILPEDHHPMQVERRLILEQVIGDFAGREWYPMEEVSQDVDAAVQHIALSTLSMLDGESAGE